MTFIMDKFKAACIIISIMGFIIVIQYLMNENISNQRDKSYIQINELNAKIKDQNEAIDQLVIAQEKKSLQVKQAQEDAQKSRNEYNKAAKSILAQKVPKNCEKSILWGIDQGRKICECWAVEC